MKEIKNINKVSLAKITALIYGFVGFFVSLIVAILVMSNIIINRDFAGSVILVTLFNTGAGLLLGILAALLTALIGWMIGYVTAGIYNIFASKAGGIKIELVDAAEIKKEDNTVKPENN